MLKFIKHHMTSIDGIEIYPILSLLIFVIFFAGLGWHVARMKKETIDELKNYPLNEKN